jgi:hypothetical protein
MAVQLRVEKSGPVLQWGVWNERRNEDRKRKRLEKVLRENPDIAHALEERRTLQEEVSRLRADLLAASTTLSAGLGSSWSPASEAIRTEHFPVQIQLASSRTLHIRRLEKEVIRLQKELDAALCRNLGYEAKLQAMSTFGKGIKREMY